MRIKERHSVVTMSFRFISSPKRCFGDMIHYSYNISAAEKMEIIKRIKRKPKSIFQRIINSYV